MLQEKPILQCFKQFPENKARLVSLTSMEGQYLLRWRCSCYNGSKWVPWRGAPRQGQWSQRRPRQARPATINHSSHKKRTKTSHQNQTSDQSPRPATRARPRPSSRSWPRQTINAEWRPATRARPRCYQDLTKTSWGEPSWMKRPNSKWGTGRIEDFPDWTIEDSLYFFKKEFC